MLLGDGQTRSAPVQDLDTVALQLDRWDRASAAQRIWADGRDGMSGAKVAVRMVEGDQWEPEDASKLRASGRLPLTFNKIAPLTRVLSGYFRQNRYDIRYLPGSDGVGMDETAKALTQTVKQISEANQSPWNDAEVFRDGIFTGRGYFDIRLDQTRNIFGEVKETVLDPFSVYPDPEADTYDPMSWQFVQVSNWLTWNDILLIFGPAGAELVDSRGAVPGRVFGNVIGGTMGDQESSPQRWFGLYDYLGEDVNRFIYAGTMTGGSPYEHIDRHRKLIRLIECQHRKLVKVRQFVDLQTGQKKTIPEHWDRERIKKVIDYMAFHNMPLEVIPGFEKRVRHTITAADVMLYDDWSPYDTFTVVPFFAYFRRGKTRGMVDDLVDPQREINKRRSVFLHIVMTTANSGWMWEKGALSDEMKELIENEGARPGIGIEYEMGKNKPERITPVVAPQALDRLEQKATTDLKEISGINDSALGQVDRVQSGVAIRARQKQSVIGAEDYFDNFARTRELKGRKHLELIQNFYTEERLIRVRGEDGKNIDTIINHKLGDGRILNDVTLGSYAVAVDEAPMAATFDQGQFDEMVTMVKDLGVPIPPDIIVDASNVPRKREIINRLVPPMPAPGAPGEPQPGAAPPAPMGPPA